jgi:hypothetical protein
MSRVTLQALSIALISVLACAPTSLVAQRAGSEATEGGAFQQKHPDLYALIEPFELNQLALYAKLASVSRHGVAPAPSEAGAAYEMGPFESETYQEMLGRLRSGPGTHVHPESLEGSAFGVPLNEIVHRTYALRRLIFDVYSDDTIADKRAPIERAIDEYLSQPELGLPAIPKTMDIMHDHPSTLAFDGRYGQLNGLVWASHWLQLASLEPMFLYDTEEERSAGLALTVERFWTKTDPANAPLQMPMAPTIGPELLTAHPRAGAIFDNLTMLQEVIMDVLVDDFNRNKAASVAEAVHWFQDPQYRPTDEMQWILMALRHGIYDQGGPAVGTLSASERAGAGGHQSHGAGGRPTLMSPGM